MGNFFRKPNTVQEHLQSIKDMSKVVSTADSYDVVVNIMFADSKFNPGRVEVWYIFSKSVRNHLPVSEHELLDLHFSKWICLLRQHLTDYTKIFHDIENEWKKTRWIAEKASEFS